jgi:glycine/D-amino acid oxidase-like deaminating enzyme
MDPHLTEPTKGIGTPGGRGESLSFWMSSVDDDLAPRAALPNDIDVDVAIVGAGYTGLWSAYYLTVADPTLRIAVIEAQIAGYGASGRNGGWCSALFPQSVAALSRRYGRPAALALHRVMKSTVDEVGRASTAEGIDCHFAKGGTVVLARNAAQWVRARAEVRQAREHGLGEDDLVLLGRDEARRRCAATGVLGATYTPDCATIHPARLVRGLARAVERRGVRVYEQTPAIAIRPRIVHTTHGKVRAEVVVRATEGYTSQLPGHRRTVVPLYSLMIATEPLPEPFWATVGLADRETFADHRNLIIYGQRTADGRLAFGGRGAPYHYGSALSPEFDCVPRVHAELARALRELFPALDMAQVSHVWGGPLGVTRDWTASVGLDRGTSVAWAGGYVGDGVGTANLAGRTLAALITGQGDGHDLVRLAWVNHHSPSWTPEPLRWLGINAGLRVMESADAAEARWGKPARRAALIGWLLGAS